MIKDIFIPSKIGSYYVFSKRVLGFEINAKFVQASLVLFSRNRITIENSMNIALMDQSQTSIVNAIKKIATTIGRYDEVVTSLTSSAVIFKELVLPFIGREKIKMIVNYEVESQLPFSLEEAVVDFIITDENKEKSQTTILVAATRQVDLDNHIAYFEKAGVTLQNVTLDMFALYDFYDNAMHTAQINSTVLLVDFAVDAIRILYIRKGILTSVRLVSYGLITMMSKADDVNNIAMQHRVIDEFLQHNGQEELETTQHEITEKIILDFSKQIKLSLSFFQKQIKNFEMPIKIVCLGAGTGVPNFLQQVEVHTQIPVQILDIKKILFRNNIIVQKKAKIDAQHSASFIIALSASHYGDVNFLSSQLVDVKNRLLNRQLFSIVCISIFAIAGAYFYSQHQLNIWNKACDSSKKEIVKILKEQMAVEVKSSARVSDMVAAAQNKLEQFKKVCFSFSQKNHSFLRHLQQLSSKIDRDSLGLDVKKLSLHDTEVILQGSVKDFAALQVFEEELMELSNFTLKDIPGELAFTVVLHAHDNQDKK